jgi:hypothetical protein
MLAIWIGLICWRCQIHIIKKVLIYSKRCMEHCIQCLNMTQKLDEVAQIAIQLDKTLVKINTINVEDLLLT